MRKLIILSLSLFLLKAEAQHTNILLGNNYSSNFNHLIYNDNSNYHTSFKPIIKSDLNFDIDSVLEENNISNYSNWYLRKIFSEHFFVLEGENYKVSASPIINLTVGKELIDKKNIFTNTRGYIITGDLGKKISFFSAFTENQSIFPNYLDSSIRLGPEYGWVVPGQGIARDFKETGFDYAMSSGYVSYRLNKMFAVQFGHGKHFIGDGYRSLLLSDNSFNYPYLRVQTTFWKVQYTNLYTEFQDINYFENNGIDNYDQMGFAKKYMSAHYLSINATKKLNISLFESVIWRMNHAPGNNGFDVNYLNPIAMLRPIEFSINSPDNVLVGVNSKYKLPFQSYVYGQLILDEFSLNDLRAKNGFWANKFGYQLGYKIFNTLGVENLTLQTEYNLVRPYTYAHHNPQQNYAHYNQPLAHPLGANFSELLFLAHYKLKRWELNGKLIFAKYGADFENDLISYGNDLYESTGTFEQPNGFVHGGRPSDFDIELYQGNLTIVTIKSFNIAYVVNPKTNLKINLGILLRDFSNEDSKLQTHVISFGIVSDLFNHYYDF
jgi:hypothetical protein